MEMRRFFFALAFVACSSAEQPSSPAPSAATSTDGGATGACPRAGAPAPIAPIAAGEVDEASGIAASALNEGAYWVHNDSGDAARAFAVSSTGALLATLTFDAAEPADIEDMAIEDGPGGSFLYFGDIGDNAVARPALTIHRVAEPRLSGTAPVTLDATSEKMTVTYGDAPHDAETLLFDPITKDLLIVTKVLFGRAHVHRVGPFVAGTTATTTRIASIPAALATGGAISRDGRLVAVRGYGTTASLWVRAPGEDLATALARPPCSVPVATEAQGEAFAFLPDGGGYVTVSEGAGAALNLARFE
ncbi:MAG: hypothetical protein KIT84_23220 [Labilithrix sp.]|nr:hypothetical protein [Labilithrix sp.]MCW5813958.1 hypothetical protein [Labilithrix sp.]